MGARGRSAFGNGTGPQDPDLRMGALGSWSEPCQAACDPLCLGENGDLLQATQVTFRDLGCSGKSKPHFLSGASQRVGFTPDAESSFAQMLLLLGGLDSP
jgi:hypothetical protein